MKEAEKVNKQKQWLSDAVVIILLALAILVLSTILSS
jgi:hypothetical protein